MCVPDPPKTNFQYTPVKCIEKGAYSRFIHFICRQRCLLDLLSRTESAIPKRNGSALKLQCTASLQLPRCTKAAEAVQFFFLAGNPHCQVSRVHCLCVINIQFYMQTLYYLSSLVHVKFTFILCLIICLKVLDTNNVCSVA